MAKYDLGESIANEHHVESSLVCQFRRRKIVCGNKSDSLSALLASNIVWSYSLFSNCRMRSHRCPPMLFGPKADTACQISRRRKPIYRLGTLCSQTVFWPLT